MKAASNDRISWMRCAHTTMKTKAEGHHMYICTSQSVHCVCKYVLCSTWACTIVRRELSAMYSALSNSRNRDTVLVLFRSPYKSDVKTSKNQPGYYTIESLYM